MEFRNNVFLLILILLLVLNVFSFFTMFLDKNKSKNNSEKRIPEGLLFFMAAVFGSLGVYAGMFAFRHKTKKWYFLVGIPIIFIENISFLYLFYTFLFDISF